jgi:hypothetical protein
MSDRPRLRVVFEQAGIVNGGDIGTAEIYFEGWVDDGAAKKSFRVPQKGYIPEVHDGQTLQIETVLFEGTPKGDALHVHIEGWDEDLGRDSTINPDDLLGTFDRVYTEADRWGVGRHASIPLATEDGEWLLTLRIEKI